MVLNTISIRAGNNVVGGDLPFFIVIIIDAMNRSVGSGNSHQGHLRTLEVSLLHSKVTHS